MTTMTDNPSGIDRQPGALLSRSGHHCCDVLAAVATGGSNGPVAALLLVSYPAWDALANWIDAHGSGGLRTNPTQALNVAVSLVAAIAVAVALQLSMNAVLAVFGIWAIAAGLAQLITAFAAGARSARSGR